MISNNDLNVKCSRELFELEYQKTTQKVRWVPRYFEIDYQLQRDGLPPAVATGQAVKNLIASGSTPIYRMPALRLVRFDGKDVNAIYLGQQAALLAESYLKSREEPAKYIIVQGFFASEINGVVHKIQIEQTGPRTVFETNTFFLAPSEQLAAYDSIDESHPTEKFPMQSYTAGENTTAGS